MNRRSIASALIAAGLCGHAFFVPVSIAGTQIALGVALCGLLLDWRRPERTPLDWPALAFVSICILSDLLSPFGPPSLAFATLWRALIGFFVVFHGLRRTPQAPVLEFLGIGLSLASIAGLLQFSTGIDIVYLLHLRAAHAMVEAPGVPGHYAALGFFTSRLTFGGVATVSVAFIAGTPSRKSWLWVPVILGLVAIALTFDRGAYLGLIAATAAIALLSARRARIAIGAALALLGALLVPAVRARFLSSFSTQGKGNEDRIFIWSRAREIIADHPLRGVGFGNYPRALGPYYDRYDPHFFMRTWAHNLELSTLAETGPFGLLALLWLFGSILVALARKRAAGGLAAVCAFLAIAQVHDALYDNKVMYAVWLAAAAGLHRATTASAADRSRS